MKCIPKMRPLKYSGIGAAAVLHNLTSQFNLTHNLSSIHSLEANSTLGRKVNGIKALKELTVLGPSKIFELCEKLEVSQYCRITEQLETNKEDVL
jgi:hypothetical protein